MFCFMVKYTLFTGDCVMKKDKKNEYEYHKDLSLYEKEYSNRIEKFLTTNPETRVVFLNADFGWGKTTFIENNLKVSENCIYSPWLNKSDNYLEEIYYNVTRTDKGKLNSLILFITSIITIFTVFSGSVISILIEIFKGNDYTCQFKMFELVCLSKDNLPLLFTFVTLIILLLIILLYICIYCKPIPLVSFYKKGNGKYYEKRIIGKIVKRVNNVLVIEDIDRSDDIENILIEVNKISTYIKENNLNKYILITGDYVRTTRRISDVGAYYSYNVNLADSIDKGTILMEKIISLRIDFPSIKTRMDNVFKEKQLFTKLKKIEYDEIINFIVNKSLSIRFFVRFLEKNESKIKEGYSLYHLLLNYYREEKSFNIDENVLNKSMYNTLKFPVCMNDVEMILQCKKIKLPNADEYSERIITKNNNGVVKATVVNNNIVTTWNYEDNIDIIISEFLNILSGKKDAMVIFKKFYQSNSYPYLFSDCGDIGNNIVSVGSTLGHNNIKNDLDNYLIGFSNNEFGLVEKRCYFSPNNLSNNYDIYKINQIDFNRVSASVVGEGEFIVAYIACFMRDNNLEMKKNYPEIYKLIEKNIHL